MNHGSGIGEDYVDAFTSLALVDVGVGDERRRTGKTRSTVGDGHCCAVHVHFSIAWRDHQR